MVNIIKDYIPINPYHRDGVKLRKFSGVTIHETSNTTKGANAKVHRNYIHNLVANGDKQYIGYHYFVDDKEAYLVTPTDERVWINGDGANGRGNNETVSIEICVNSDGDFKKARENAAWLVAYELKQHGFKTVIDGMNDKTNGNLFQHYSWSGKNCPMLIRANGYWNDFVKTTQKFLNELWNEVADTSEVRYFKINTVFNDGKWSPSQKGAFPYKNSTEREKAKKQAIDFYIQNNLGSEYKVFDYDGTIVYPEMIANPSETEKTYLEMYEELTRMYDELYSDYQVLEEEFKAVKKQCEVYKIENLKMVEAIAELAKKFPAE